MATELETKKATDLAKVNGAMLPSFMDVKDSAKGFEDMDSSTKAIPFIKVLNSMSPELDKDSEGYMAGAEQGDIVNTVSHFNYKKKIQVVCVKFEHIFTEWRPNRGGFAGYHTPLEADKIAVDKTFGAWKTKEGNDLVDTYMYYFVIVGHENDGVVVFAADSSDLKEGKKLNAMLSTRFDGNGQRAQIYHQINTMATIKASNDQGKWYKPVYEFVGYIQEESLYLAVKALREALDLEEVKVDYNQMQGAESKKASVPDDSEY